MIGAIVAAGGRGTRLGGHPKGLLLLEGEPLVLRLSDALRSARLSPVVVVAGPETLALLAGRPGVLGVPSDPSQPMVDSLARGAALLPRELEGAIVQPVDAPFTSPELVARLVAGGVERPRVACHRGAPGHPVLLPTRYLDALHARPPGGLRAILASAEVELLEWPDPSVLCDLDTPEDLARWRITLVGDAGR